MGIEPQLLRAMPEHGTFTGRAVDQNVRGLVRGAASHLHGVQVDARTGQALDLNAPALVIADSPDVFRAKPQARARDQGSRDLAAGAEDFLFECEFAGVSGKRGKNQKRISGIQAHADDVEVWHLKRTLRVAAAGG